MPSHIGSERKRERWIKRKPLIGAFVMHIVDESAQFMNTDLKIFCLHFYFKIFKCHAVESFVKEGRRLHLDYKTVAFL